MPYITRTRRANLDPDIKALAGRISGKAQLNYAITKLVHLYVDAGIVNYDAFSDVEGTLQCVSKEFYRTVVAPYEDKKRKENGSVSSLDAVKLPPVNVPSIFDPDCVNPPGSVKTTITIHKHKEGKWVDMSGDLSNE